MDCLQILNQLKSIPSLCIYVCGCSCVYPPQVNGAQALYMLYQDQGGSWRIQAVPLDPNSFQSRKALPTEWRGLRDEELSAKCGVPGAIFIHASGFIGGHQTKDGALAMAIKVGKIVCCFFS